MKEEIKNNFIKISQDAVSEIKRDMMVLHRDSKDLKNGFEKLRLQEHEASEQMDKLIQSVEGLRNNLERSEREYQELKRLNYKLKDDLTKLSKTMTIKEKENEELENKLQKKTEDYNALQRTMKSLKSDHEERLERLKAVHKEKIRLEDEYEKALAVKEEAEVKFHIINQETKEAEIKHINEVSELQRKIKIKVCRIEDLERDKNELAKQLSLMEKNIEELTIENKQLKDDLAKKEQENGMSNTLQKVHSLPSFCPHNPPHRRAPPTFKYEIFVILQEKFKLYQSACAYFLKM